MEHNVGGIDRGVRIAAGILLILFALLSDSAYRWWGLIGIVPLVTGLVGWCPAYLPFGFRTCKR